MRFERHARGRGWSVLALALVMTVAFATLAPAQDTAAAAETAVKHNAGPLGFLGHFLDSLGWVFGPLLGVVSICLFALVVLLILDLRMSVIVPPGFVEEFTDTVNKRQFKQAFDLARNDTSFLARVLTAGMSRLQYGLEDAREASRNMLASIKSSKDQLNSYLAVIGTLGPLLGLVGTVFGMILAFMTMKTGINAQELSGDISKALCITLAGVGLAVPAIFFNAFFKNRIIHVSMDCENIADDLLTQMYHNSKKPAPPSGQTATIPPNGPATGATTAAPVKPA